MGTDVAEKRISKSKPPKITIPRNFTKFESKPFLLCSCTFRILSKESLIILKSE